jgi:hypothetical protein
LPPHPRRRSPINRSVHHATSVHTYSYSILFTTSVTRSACESLASLHILDPRLPFALLAPRSDRLDRENTGRRINRVSPTAAFPLSRAFTSCTSWHTKEDGPPSSRFPRQSTSQHPPSTSESHLLAPLHLRHHLHSVPSPSVAAFATRCRSPSHPHHP